MKERKKERKKKRKKDRKKKVMYVIKPTFFAIGHCLEVKLKKKNEK